MMDMGKEKSVYLEDIVIETRDKVDLILRYLTNGQNMKVADVARYFGVSRQALYSSKRYLLPGFGREIPKNGWPMPVVAEWASHGQDRLYEAWKNGEEIR